MRRSVILVCCAVFLVSSFPTVAGAVGNPSSLPVLSLIVPAEFLRHPAIRDAIYDRMTNIFVRAYPACIGIRAYHHLTPLGSTARITVRCTAWESRLSHALPRT